MSDELLTEVQRLLQEADYKGRVHVPLAVLQRVAVGLAENERLRGELAAAERYLEEALKARISADHRCYNMLTRAEAAEREALKLRGELATLTRERDEARAESNANAAGLQGTDLRHMRDLKLWKVDQGRLETAERERDEARAAWADAVRRFGDSVTKMKDRAERAEAALRDWMVSVDELLARHHNDCGECSADGPCVWVNPIYVKRNRTALRPQGEE
jgi:hypothetical protein